MCVPNHGDISKIASSVALHPALLLRSWRCARFPWMRYPHRSSPAVEGRRPPAKAAILDRTPTLFTAPPSDGNNTLLSPGSIPWIAGGTTVPLEFSVDD